MLVLRRSTILPDKRKHRGPHPEDVRLFAELNIPSLRMAVWDLSWLLTRGYAITSASKIVGDRYALNRRQRIAVTRCACSDQAKGLREHKQIARNECRGQDIWIDGFNILTCVEAALSGGVILVSRDGAYRDMASMHGNYRRVTETQQAIELIGHQLAETPTGNIRWLLDTPVSNSGRLKAHVAEVAESNGWAWDIQLVPDPDVVLSTSDAVAASSDSQILDRCRKWFSLSAKVIQNSIPDAWIIDLSDEQDRG